MRLLLDEMYSVAVAEQFRSRGHDVVSVNEPGLALAGSSDAEVYAAAVDQGRALVTEDVMGFRRLEADAISEDKLVAVLIFTSDQRYPRGAAATTGRLVRALHSLLNTNPGPATTSLFLDPPD